MKDYINKKIEEFIQECDNIESKLDRYDDDYKKQWKRDKKYIRETLYQQITSISDVREYINCYVYSVEREKSLKVLNLDIYDTDLALYKAIYALKIMANQYDNCKCNFKPIDKNEIDDFFESLKKAYKEMKAELLCRTSYN